MVGRMSEPAKQYTETVSRDADGICLWVPSPGWTLGRPCISCKHSDIAHIGTGRCVICEMEWRLSPEYARRELRRRQRTAQIPLSGRF